MKNIETKYNDFFYSNIHSSENTFFAVFNVDGIIIDMNYAFLEILKKFDLVAQPKNIFQTPRFEYFLSKINSEDVETKLNVTIGTEKNIYLSLISTIKYSYDKFYFYGEVNSNEVNHLMKEFIILNNETQNLNRKLKKNEISLQNTAKELNIEITERKFAEEKIKKLFDEKELILREVNHRIKNNMNTIYGLLILKANTIENSDTKEILEDAASRVQSMMVLYDKLYKSPDVQKISIKNYLPALVDEIIMNFPNSKLVKVEKNIDDIVLHAKKMQPLGMIINELLTNIMKYAFTDRKNGIITVSASMKENIVYIMIQDNGNGIPESVDFKNSTGFGLQLVSMLTKDLKGTIRIERGNGTKIILEFQL